MHFSRDAQLAEEWILKEELNISGKDRGVCIVFFNFLIPCAFGETRRQINMSHFHLIFIDEPQSEAILQFV